MKHCCDMCCGRRHCSRERLAYVLKRGKKYLAACGVMSFARKRVQRLALRIGERGVAVRWMNRLNIEEHQWLERFNKRYPAVRYDKVELWRVVALVRGHSSSS